MKIAQWLLLVALLFASSAFAQAEEKPAKPEKPKKLRGYSLPPVDMKLPLLWAAEVREPEGKGLAFGGHVQNGEDSNAGTRVWKDGEWKSIREELRDNNRLQRLHGLFGFYRVAVKHLLAYQRADYLSDSERNKAKIAEGLEILTDDAVAKFAENLTKESWGEYQDKQAVYAREKILAAAKLLKSLPAKPTAESLATLRQVQIQFEQAAEALDSEPAARALHCGKPREKDARPEAQCLVYEPKSGLYVLFGGDHLDYLTNDTWVFDPVKVRWFQRHPKNGSPPPRSDHRMEVQADGRIKMKGGYTYRSSDEYVAGQYAHLDDGEWIYDVAKDEWSAVPGSGPNEGKLMPADTRTYRTGAYLPEFFLQGEKPDAAKFQKWLAELPANQWFVTNPPYKPVVNRDWGCSRISPLHDVMLRWSGGHSAHGGTDVPHYHFSTNRWELPYPIELPLGQLYNNTEYPKGTSFNHRAWMTGHTYQSYEVDHATGNMVFAGQSLYSYRYNPTLADWTDRAAKPKAMVEGSSFYTLTMVATSQGIACWDARGGVHFWDDKKGEWYPLKLTGDKLRGAVVDGCCIAFDSKRNRLLTFTVVAYAKPSDGQVQSVDIKTGEVKTLNPAGMELCAKFAHKDRCTYVPEVDGPGTGDLVLMASYLKGQGDVTRTPAYDCEKNHWVTLDLKYDFRGKGESVRRIFPHDHNCGLFFDAKRKLLWGTDADSQIYVMRLDLKKADMQPLK